MKKCRYLPRLLGIPIACRSFYTNDTKVCNLQHCWPVKNGKMAADLMATSPGITAAQFGIITLTRIYTERFTMPYIRWFKLRIINILGVLRLAPLFNSESHVTKL